MAGLVDIAPVVENVDIGGNPIPVYGVSAKGIASLLARFPELRMMMSGKEVAIEQLMAMGGDAVAAIIAAGCGFPGDPDQEAAAARFSADTQADLLGPILRLTMPKGVGPFVEKLAKLGSVLGEVSSTAPASKSRKQSSTSRDKESLGMSSGA